MKIKEDIGDYYIIKNLPFTSILYKPSLLFCKLLFNCKTKQRHDNLEKNLIFCEISLSTTGCVVLDYCSLY